MVEQLNKQAGTELRQMRVTLIVESGKIRQIFTATTRIFVSEGAVAGLASAHCMGAKVTTFSAAPQALGYLYQARVALLLLLQAPDETRIKVEALDDIELNNALTANSLALIQLKHHTSPTVLTDASPDLWKSLRVWAEQAASHTFVVSDTRIMLLTTSKVSIGSAPSFLAETKRDVEKADSLLMLVATTSTNKSLTASFTAYCALPDTQRKALLSKVYIIPEQADIAETRKRIEQILRLAVRAQHVTAFTDRIEGWWNDKIVLHLLAKDPAFQDGLSGFELHEQTAAVSESFHTDSLPIDFLNVPLNDDDITAHGGRQYVKQLESIKASSKTIRKAILDHHRAYNQRHRWLKDGLIFSDELVRYEELLRDEWERFFEHSCGDVDLSNHVALLEAGRKVLRWAELECTLRIRARVDADFVRRGCFHILADRSPPEVHWHPNFLAEMQATMLSAAKAL